MHAEKMADSPPALGRSGLSSQVLTGGLGHLVGCDCRGQPSVGAVGPGQRDKEGEGGPPIFHSA